MLEVVTSRLLKEMSEEQLKAFWEAIQADTNLQEKLKGVTDFGAVAEIAKEAGFLISAEELDQAQTSAELSDEELGGVAGGTWQSICFCC